MARGSRVKQRRRTRLGVTKGSSAAAARRKQKDPRKRIVRRSRKQRDIRTEGGVRKVRKSLRKPGVSRAPGKTARRRTGRRFIPSPGAILETLASDRKRG